MPRAEDLLLEIFNCGLPNKVLNSGFLEGLKYPCRKVVDAQFSDKNSSINGIDQWHRPEPWSGPLHLAKLLFLSSNPSFDHREKYPTKDFESNEVVMFFENRFSDRRYTSADLEPGPAFLKDGKYGKASKFWDGIQWLSSLLLPNEGSLSGGKVCLSEIVHCKSKKEVGVQEALETCANLYLSRLLRSAEQCQVVIVLGGAAASLIRQTTSISETAGLQRYLDKTYVFSPHTAMHGDGFREFWRREEDLQSKVRVALGNGPDIPC